MSGYTSVITRKGQATIPVELRRSLGLDQGVSVIWSQENGHLVGRPAKSVTERTAGIIKRNDQGAAPSLEEIDRVVERAIAIDALDLGDEE